MENRSGRLRLECRQSTDPDGAVRMTLLGEVDIAVADDLAHRLGQLERSRRRARLDLSELQFIDLCGLDSIMAALKSARRTGWELEVDPRVSRSVERIIAFAGVAGLVWPSRGPLGASRDQTSPSFARFTPRWSITSLRAEP
jgi:anti-anti-sigma factor